jgi:hypothetical protein
MSHAPAPPDPDQLDAAVAAFQTMPVPDRPADDVVLARLAAGTMPAAEPVSRSRRKLLMRVATWSLAASVLAAVGGVLLFGGTPPVALADVVKAAEKHRLVKYRCTFVTEADPPPGVTVNPTEWSNESVMYADLRAPRYRHVIPETVTADGLIRWSEYTVIDYAAGRQLTVRANELADPAAVPDREEGGKLLRENVGPRPKWAVLTVPPAFPDENPKHTLLDRLRDWQGRKNTTVAEDGGLVRYTIPGEAAVTTYTAEAVTTTQVATTTTLWVDPATKLPVRMTTELARREPHGNRTVTELADFEWDPQLPDGVKSADDLFSLTPPDGYPVDDRTKGPPAGGPRP